VGVRLDETDHAVPDQHRGARPVREDVEQDLSGSPVNSSELLEVGEDEYKSGGLCSPAVVARGNIAHAGVSLLHDEAHCLVQAQRSPTVERIFGLVGVSLSSPREIHEQRPKIAQVVGCAAVDHARTIDGAQGNARLGREARGRADDHYLRCTSPDAIDGGREAVFATNVVFEPLVGEPVGSSLVQHAAPKRGLTRPPKTGGRSTPTIG